MEENITKRAPTQYIAAYIRGGKNSVQPGNLHIYPIQAITNLSKEKQTNH